MDTILPAIALRCLVPLPNNDIRTEIGRKMSLMAIEESEKNYDGQVILLIQKNKDVENPEAEDLEKVGVLAKISMKVKLPTGNHKVKFNILKRVEINNITIDKTRPIFVEYNEMESEEENSDEELILIKMISEKIGSDSQNILSNASEILKEIQKGVSNEKFADIIANNIKRDNHTDEQEFKEKLKYLNEKSLVARLKMILIDIEKEKSFVDLENKINAEVKKSIDESQKEYYLREKMRAIQNELGEKAKKEEEIENLRKKILEAQMPKSIEKKALEELNKYSSYSPMQAENGMMRNYLDLLIELPWVKQTEDCNDLVEVKNRLDKEHFGLEKVKERILEYLAVKILTGKNPQTILCLVGAPGVGKTTLGKSIANALGRKFIVQKLGGVNDEAEIRGHRRTYVGALPGRIIAGMKKAGVINPVFLLDEIDKLAPGSYRGDPTSAMLEVLDPNQNKEFSDNFLEEPYDLSNVLFITTANTLDNIPAPLRDRMEIISVDSYTEYEKFNIAKDYVIPKSLEKNGLNDERFSIDDEAIMDVIKYYTREGGVRELGRKIDTIVRKSVKKVLFDKIEKVEVNHDNLSEYLGKPIFDHNKSSKKNRIGVVTGLAYTQFGGDTLDIEVTYYKGKGGLILTGKLGDVMKESAQIALSFVESHAKEFSIDPNIFKENDIHIHVPEGATPKDGPSAGVTLTTAIVSCLTGREVYSTVGMTGEVTLTGNVLPIGGLKEKSIAAKRSGLKKIFIPKENVRDIDDIPQEVKDELEIKPVEHVTEIIKEVLI